MTIEYDSRELLLPPCLESSPQQIKGMNDGAKQNRNPFFSEINTCTP